MTKITGNKVQIQFAVFINFLIEPYSPICKFVILKTCNISHEHICTKESLTKFPRLHLASLISVQHTLHTHQVTTHLSYLTWSLTLIIQVTPELPGREILLDGRLWLLVCQRHSSPESAQPVHN